MALGYRHLTGIGCNKNCEIAVRFYHDAAQQVVGEYLSGPPYPLQTPTYKIRLYDNVGGIYGSGASGSGAAEPEDTTLGALTQDDIIQFYQYNAERNDVSAQFILGQLYYTGTATVPQNFERAFRFLYAAASQLPMTSSSALNEQQQQPKQLTQSIKISAHAAGLLGEMYWRGDGVQQDNSTALKWFHRAAEYGDPNGYLNLGLMYLYGVVVQKVRL